MTASRRVPGWLLLVGAMTAVGPVSTDMYLPGFPQIEREFAQHGVERTMAGYMAGIALGQLFYGPLSDRFGRKPPLYAGFILYLIGAVGCWFATGMTQLAVMRVLQALGACSGLVIGRAIIRDRCQPHEAARAFATLMMIVALGPIVAPMVGAWFVTHLGWRSVFVFQCVVGCGLLIAVHRILVESRNPLHVTPLSLRSVAKRYIHLLSDREFAGYSLMGGFGMGALFSFVVGSATVFAHSYQLSPQDYGWMLGVNGLALMSASRVNMAGLRKKSPAQLLARAIFVPLSAGALLILLTLFSHPPLWSVILLQFVFFMGVATLNPNVTALALAPHAREAGSASALMGSIQSAISMLSVAVLAAFTDGTLRTLAIIMTTGAACAVIMYWWVRWGRRADMSRVD